MNEGINSTILVVDDNPTNLKVLLETLEMAGFDVLIATDGNEAIQRAELGQPGLILLDVLMPGMDGFETCRRLKAHPGVGSIPVIFMTALHDTQEKLTAFASGAVDYVTKPFSHEEVLMRVRTHLTLRSLQQTLQTRNRLLESTSAQLQAISAALMRFLDTDSLSEASAVLLAAALGHSAGRCGFMGMVSEAGGEPPLVHVLAMAGSPKEDSPGQALVSRLRSAMGHADTASLPLAELEALIGPVITEAVAALGSGTPLAPAMRPTRNGEGFSVPIVQRDAVVGWLTVLEGPANGGESPLLDRFTRPAGVLYAYERLRRREAESQLRRQRAEEAVDYLREEIRIEHPSDQVVGNSPALHRVLDMVRLVAPTDSTVMIHGETGTGKELIARAIHDASPRRERPMIKVNCAAIPENLVESELFGHERGAFTGATAQRKGRFELADGGTLFLDEIGDMPLSAQMKLLRVLQEQEFERVGGSQSVRVDVRVLAATHRDLGQLIAEGRFRQDLYYRLNVFPLTLPPLRHRPDDIVPLAELFARRFAARLGRPLQGLSEDAIARLQRYHWPGNVRELENVVERSVILSQGPVLELPDGVPCAPAPAVDAIGDGQGDRAPVAVPASSLDEMQRRHIIQVMEQTRWVIEGPRGAAARLGLKPSTLRNRMHKLGIRKTGQ